MTLASLSISAESQASQLKAEKETQLMPREGGAGSLLGGKEMAEAWFLDTQSKLSLPEI